MKTSNYRRNIMGTVSFDGIAPGMRKPQDFIVCPMQDSGEQISIQMKHLLYINGVGAIVDIDRRATSSGDYAQLYDAIKEQSGVCDKWAFAEIVELDRHQEHSGVFWDWELAGPDGASYRIHVLPDVSKNAVAACKAHIRRSFDCVRMSVNRITRLIPFVMPTFNHEEINLREIKS